jgi:hypothetical protein
MFQSLDDAVILVKSPYQNEEWGALFLTGCWQGCDSELPDRGKDRKPGGRSTGNFVTDCATKHRSRLRRQVTVAKKSFVSIALTGPGAPVFGETIGAEVLKGTVSKAFQHWIIDSARVDYAAEAV